MIVNDTTLRVIQMSKLEDNVNEILGIEKKEEKFSLQEFEQPASVPRKIDASCCSFK